MDQGVKAEVVEVVTPLTAVQEDGGLLELFPATEQNAVTVAAYAFSQTLRPPTFPDRDVEVTEKRVRLKIKKRSSSDSKDVSNRSEKCGSCKKTMSPSSGPSIYGDVKSPALIRAEEVQSNLDPTYPSFLKPLVRSHVGSCFWMGLPGPFCRMRLPDKDCMFTLEDENEKEYGIKYIAHKTGLSAGWRQFAVVHNLREGDVLIFQLVEPTKFKVYTIRRSDLTEVDDGALGLLNLNILTNQMDVETVACKIAKRKHSKSLPLAVIPGKNRKTGIPRLAASLGQPSEQSENDSEEVRSEVLEGFRLTVPALQFEDIKTFENFKIMVDGLCIDSELPEDIRRKYYNLCCSQNTFLHDNLIEGINYKLIVGSISETVNIADATRACKLTTSREEYENWGKTLKAFELLGMNVGFLHGHLHRLVNLAFDNPDATETKRFIEARTIQAHIEDEIITLQARLMELKEASLRCDNDIERLKLKAESYELKFQEEAAAPW